MKDTGVTFDVHTIRVTEVNGATAGDVPILGKSIVRRNFSVRLTPVIEVGKTYRHPPEGPIMMRHKAVDKFQHFEFELQPGGPLRWLRAWDRDLRQLLDGHCAIELWTKSTTYEPGYPWIHWLFSSSSWLRAGYGRWTGRSYSEGPRMKPDDYPLDQLAITDGGFWKTATPPPEAERSFL